MTAAPGPCALDDRYAALLLRAVCVTERAAEAAASGDSSDRMFLAQQVSGLTSTLEHIRDVLADMITPAYEQGYRDGAAQQAEPRLRLVAR